MPLERLVPLVKKYDLGCLRLWQDELAEIVRLVRQLPDVEVRIESDNNLLTDVQSDLPQLGQRVSYFEVLATRSQQGGDSPQEVIKIRLAADQCLIEAVEPDLTTTGLIEGIKSIAASCRRMPTSLLPLYRTTASVSTVAGVEAYASAGIVFTLVPLVVGVIFGVGAVQHLVHAHGTPVASWPLSISVSIPLLALAAVMLVGAVRSRTLLFTAMRADAPTFWQRKRSDIAINVVVGLVLYLLGLLTAHL